MEAQSAKRKEQNPRRKEKRERFQGPYNHQETDHTSRGNCERGATTKRGRGGHGGRSNQGGVATHADKRKAKIQKSWDKGGEKHGDGVCHRWGARDHWFKNCTASKGFVDYYKTYCKKLAMEAYNNETEDGDGAEANLIGAHFKIAKDSIDETPDFD